MSAPIASIVIPAYNEAGRIGHTLRTLLADAAPGKFEVIVVANGCADGTAEIARRVPGVRVIETPIGSKPNALNLGDAEATVFPRVYLDADITLHTADLRALVAAVSTSAAVVASPTLEVAPEGVSPLVLAFYRVWRRLPYFRTAIGGGVYAVSAAGRRRWESFPSITADDAFVRLSFSSEERLVLPGCRFVISPPRDIASLVTIKTRSRRGNLELSRHFPDRRRDDAPANRRFLLGLLRRPSEWGDLGVYMGVCLLTSLRAGMKHLLNRHDRWERDESSREPVGGAA